MPRILLLTTYYHPVLGGVESHARSLAGYLHRRGLDVTIVTKRISPATPAFEHVDGIPVRRVRPSGPRRGIAKWLMVPLALLEVLRRRETFDVIVCVDYRGIGIAALLAGRILHRPVVFEAETPGALSCANWTATLERYGARQGGRLSRAIRWPMHRVYRAADVHLCISRDLEREALDAGIARSRVFYVPHGVDVKRFRPLRTEERSTRREAIGWPIDRVIGMYLGRLSIEKGVLDLLEAWNRLDDPNALLVVVGPDMKGHALDAGSAARRKVAEHGLENRVVFHGPTTSAAELLALADFFVQPSHYEAFGVSVIEALASGLPVVASNVWGMRDYLVDGENALLGPPGDTAGLAERMRRLCADPDLLVTLGKAARRTVERRFDEDRLGARCLEIIAGVATGSGAGSDPAPAAERNA